MTKFRDLATEASSLFQLAWPVSLGYTLQLSLGFVAVFSLGHIGTKELGASTLTTMVVYGLMINRLLILIIHLKLVLQCHWIFHISWSGYSFRYTLLSITYS